MASAATSRRDGGARRGSVGMAPLRGGGQARAPRCGGAQRPVCCPGGGRADGTGQTPGGRFAWRRTAPIRRLWSRPAIPSRRERDKPSLHTLLLFRELCGGHAGTVPTGGPTAGDRPAPAPASPPPPPDTPALAPNSLHGRCGIVGAHVFVHVPPGDGLPPVRPDGPVHGFRQAPEQLCVRCILHLRVRHLNGSAMGRAVNLQRTASAPSCLVAWRPPASSLSVSEPSTYSPRALAPPLQKSRRRGSSASILLGLVYCYYPLPLRTCLWLAGRLPGTFW